MKRCEFCRAATIVAGPSRQEVASMKYPPRTSDRWHLTYKWQCTRVATHDGYFYQTTDVPASGGPEQP